MHEIGAELSKDVLENLNSYPMKAKYLYFRSLLLMMRLQVSQHYSASSHLEENEMQQRN